MHRVDNLADREEEKLDVDTIAADTLEQDPSVLRRIAQEMDGRLALDAYVVQAGRVSVDDPVELM